MTEMRGLRYEISKPKLSPIDGYYYQRVRQIDEDGNLVGIGDQRTQMREPGSLIGQRDRNIDLLKLGKLGADIGKAGYGIIKRDPRTIAGGVLGVAKDIKDGIKEDYNSWPGTDAPWEYGDIPAPSWPPSKSPGLGPRDSTPGPRSEGATGISRLQQDVMVTPDSQAPPTLQATPLTNPVFQQNVPSQAQSAEGPIGLVSGKPMRFPFAAIFDTRPLSGANDDPSRRSALDDLIWNGLGSRASSRDADADAAPPLVPDRRISFGSASGPAPSAGGPDAASTVPALPDPQGPLSLNDAYLEYLRRLKAS